MDESDEKIIIFNHGFSEGQKHQSPSPDTRKFMEDTVKIMTQLQDSVVDIKDDVKCLIETNKEEHKEIITQVKTTNGRVNNIEKWKERATGFFIALQIIILPILFFLLYEWLKFKE